MTEIVFLTGETMKKPFETEKISNRLNNLAGSRQTNTKMSSLPFLNLASQTRSIRIRRIVMKFIFRYLGSAEVRTVHLCYTICPTALGFIFGVPNFFLDVA